MKIAAAILCLILISCAGSDDRPINRQSDSGSPDLDAGGDEDAADDDAGDDDAGGDDAGGDDAGGDDDAGGEDAGGEEDAGGGGDCGWSLKAGGVLADSASDVLLLDDGSVIVVGYSSMATGGMPFSADGGFAMRVDTRGAIVWSKSFPGTNITTIVPGLSSAVVAVAGVANTDGSCDTHHGLTDGWIATLSIDDGEIVLSDCIGGDDDDSIQGVAAVSGAVDFYRVFGTTDSHMSGDIGVNHNGGTFDAPDIMLGSWSAAGLPSVWCYGGDGPDSANVLIDSDTASASESSGTTGDFAAFPDADGETALFVSVDAGDLCMDPPCASPAFVENEDAFGRVLAADDGWIAGTSEITTGPFACAGAAPGSQRAFIARYDAGDVTGKVCLGTGLDRTIAQGIGSSDGAVAIVGRTSGELPGATVDGTAMPSGDAAFIALYAASPGLASEPSEIVIVNTARAVRLKSAAIRADNCVIAVGESSAGGQSDVYIYSRQLAP